jgi:hypothetical protein
VGLNLQLPPLREESWYSFLLYPSREDLIPQLALLERHFSPSMKPLFVDILCFDLLHHLSIVVHMITSVVVLVDVLCSFWSGLALGAKNLEDVLIVDNSNSNN